jgi:hypothetical protein
MWKAYRYIFKEQVNNIVYFSKSQVKLLTYKELGPWLADHYGCAVRGNQHRSNYRHLKETIGQNAHIKIV